MKLLRRNTTEFEYLPYSGTDTDLDSNGDHTGEFQREYLDPVVYRGNICAPGGKVSPTFYGDDIRYTHTLVMDDPKASINEYGLIRWKGDLYTIQAIRPSLNVLSIALQKQTIAHTDPYVDEQEEVQEPAGGEGE